jgi:hypothetical protein
MQEELSNTADPSALTPNTEFYELHLYDSGLSGEEEYYIREAHARWNASIKYVEWDEPVIRAFQTLQEAKDVYSARKIALARRGFIYSDMD